MQNQGKIVFNDQKPTAGVQPKARDDVFKTIQSTISVGRNPNYPNSQQSSSEDEHIKLERAVLPQEDAEVEVAKQSARNKIEAPKKINKLVQKAETVLMRLKVANPFDFFPDEITIEIDQVNIITKQFFATEQINSLMIKEIADIRVETGLLFATLVITDRDFRDRPIVIKYLNKEEAMRARRIIQGLRVSFDLQVDYTQFSPEDLAAKVEEIGRAH